MAENSNLADFRFHRKVAKLHRRGPRVVAELLAEIGAERLIQTLIDQKVDRCLAIPDEVLDITGGRCRAPTPLHKVQTGDLPSDERKET